MGAVVFRVRRLRGELFALLTLAVTFVLATIVLNTPHRRRTRRVPERGAAAPHPRVADRDPLPARPRHRGGRRRERVRRPPGPLGRRALRHPRRRGRGGGAGRSHLPVQAPRPRPVRGAGRRRGRHPRHVRHLRHRGRDLLDRGAALRRPDERGRRGAALARPGDRRGAGHRPDVRSHRGPDGRRRAGDGRAHADARDPLPPRRDHRLRETPATRAIPAIPADAPGPAAAEPAVARRAPRAGRRAAARLRRRPESVSRRPGARRREPRGPGRGDPRARRPERLRQVDAHQRRQRPPPGGRRADRGRRRGSHRPRRPTRSPGWECRAPTRSRGPSAT